MVTNILVGLFVLIVGLVAITVFLLLFIALSKVWMQSMAEILAQEKVKAYRVLFNELIGNVSVNAMRELSRQQDSSSKVN